MWKNENNIKQFYIYITLLSNPRRSKSRSPIPLLNLIAGPNFHYFELKTNHMDPYGYGSYGGSWTLYTPQSRGCPSGYRKCCQGWVNAVLAKPLERTEAEKAARETKRQSCADLDYLMVQCQKILGRRGEAFGWPESSAARREWARVTICKIELCKYYVSSIMIIYASWKKNRLWKHYWTLPSALGLTFSSFSKCDYSWAANDMCQGHDTLPDDSWWSLMQSIRSRKAPLKATFPSQRPKVEAVSKLARWCYLNLLDHLLIGSIQKEKRK